MKPQTMLSEDFFDLVCFELGLNAQESDEDTVISTIVKLNEDLRVFKKYTEWVGLGITLKLGIGTFEEFKKAGLADKPSDPDYRYPLPPAI